MASNKDLLDAATFCRRRLEGALLTGTSSHEPPRVLRPVAAGVALAAIAVATTYVLRYLGVAV